MKTDLLSRLFRIKGINPEIRFSLLPHGCIHIEVITHSKDGKVISEKSMTTRELVEDGIMFDHLGCCLDRATKRANRDYDSMGDWKE